jgi:PhzF family phenazine biosynthesis protein
MRNIQVYHVDAFTTEKFGGNPAGVVLNAEQLTEAEMQKIAGELRLPESAFLLPSEVPDIDFRVRFFTPTEEINFCGHATVGLAWLLATEHGYGERDGITIETNIGKIPIQWKRENGEITAVEMTQITPQTKDFEIALEELSKLTGLSVEDLDPAYPIKLANTGNWHLLVPVKNQTAIDAAEPDLGALGKHNKANEISTTHLFTFNTEKEHDIYTRDFAAGVGIPEDPVTGAANGALAGYLFLEKIISQTEITQLKIAQGDALGRPGTLYVTVVPSDIGPVIKVAGAAVISIRGNLIL